MRRGGATGAPPASRSGNHDRRSPLHPRCFATGVPGTCGSRSDNSTAVPLRDLRRSLTIPTPPTAAIAPGPQRQVSDVLRMRACHAGCSPWAIRMSQREPTSSRFATTNAHSDSNLRRNSTSSRFAPSILLRQVERPRAVSAPGPQDKVRGVLRMRACHAACFARPNSNAPPLRAFLLAHPRRLAACPAQAESSRRRGWPAPSNAH